MSKQQSKSSKASVATPSCKFCQGAGESKEVYTSHWQFSKPVDGKLTCPKLLGHKCKLCNESGHIEKRCPFPKKKQEPKQITMFCRFCYNAHCTNYTDHNQFDNDGFVICPNLSVIECQLCGVKGHTKRYCIQDPNYIGNDVTPKKAEKAIAVPGAPKKPANKFALLFVEEADEEEAVQYKAEPDIDILQSHSMEKFPCLSATGKVGKTTLLTGWAKMAAMPAQKPIAVITPEVVDMKKAARLAEYDG